jgi:hypothetical protein
MPYIRETIVTTVDEAGRVHIAPLGIIQRDDRWVIAPFHPSKTLQNLRAVPVAVASYTDDVTIFAGCVCGDRDWPLADVPGSPVPRLQAALAHSVLEVDSVEEDDLRPRLVCRVRAEGMHAPFTGMNRARAAVLELAVLVTRLHMLPPAKIDAEMAYLSIAVDKTGGSAERAAWSRLVARIQEHRGGAEATVSPAP